VPKWTSWCIKNIKIKRVAHDPSTNHPPDCNSIFAMKTILFKGSPQARHQTEMCYAGWRTPTAILNVHSWFKAAQNENCNRNTICPLKQHKYKASKGQVTQQVILFVRHPIPHWLNINENLTQTKAKFYEIFMNNCITACSTTMHLPVCRKLYRTSLFCCHQTQPSIMCTNSETEGRLWNYILINDTTSLSNHKLWNQPNPSRIQYMLHVYTYWHGSLINHKHLTAQTYFF
jgi:hypothetical protein